MQQGYVISLLPYIEDILKLYKREIKDFVMHAKPMLFTALGKESPAIRGRKLFHSVMIKVLYLEKWGMPESFWYLQMMKNWKRVVDNSPFKHVEMFIDAFFVAHEDGKGVWNCWEIP
jgi:hypothetical protein